MARMQGLVAEGSQHLQQVSPACTVPWLSTEPHTYALLRCLLPLRWQVDSSARKATGRECWQRQLIPAAPVV